MLVDRNQHRLRIIHTKLNQMVTNILGGIRFFKNIGYIICFACIIHHIGQVNAKRTRKRFSGSLLSLCLLE